MGSYRRTQTVYLIAENYSPFSIRQRMSKYAYGQLDSEYLSCLDARDKIQGYNFENVNTTSLLVA
jgi:hypothetical protein